MDFCPESVFQGKVRATDNFEIANVGKKPKIPRLGLLYCFNISNVWFSLLILKFCKCVDEGNVLFFFKREL